WPRPSRVARQFEDPSKEGGDERIRFGMWPAAPRSDHHVRGDRDAPVDAWAGRVRADPGRQARRASGERSWGLTILRGLVRDRRDEVRDVRVLQPQPPGSRRHSYRSSEPPGARSGGPGAADAV